MNRLPTLSSNATRFRTDPRAKANATRPAPPKAKKQKTAPAGDEEVAANGAEDAEENGAEEEEDGDEDADAPEDEADDEPAKGTVKTSAAADSAAEGKDDKVAAEAADGED